MSANLSRSEHITRIVSKVDCALGMIIRNINVAPVQAKSQAHHTLVGRILNIVALYGTHTHTDRCQPIRDGSMSCCKILLPPTRHSHPETGITTNFLSIIRQSEPPARQLGMCTHLGDLGQCSKDRYSKPLTVVPIMCVLLYTRHILPVLRTTSKPIQK